MFVKSFFMSCLFIKNTLKKIVKTGIKNTVFCERFVTFCFSILEKIAKVLGRF